MELPSVAEYLLAQLNVPVGQIEEMPPAIVLMTREADVYERPPFGALRLADKLKAGLVRKSVALLRITGDARTDDVLPSRLASAISWKDMIKVQVISLKGLATVLARIPVALEDIVPRKLDFFLWQPLEKQQHDDSRYADAYRNRANHFRLGIRL
jgi:hypothetical protein